jgi:hypothetical protein
MIVLKQRPNEKQLCSIEQKIKLIAVYNRKIKFGDMAQYWNMHQPQ